MTPDLAALLERFHAIDRGARALTERTGMACPSGCGACCHAPDVESSAAEFAPLAERLVREGRDDVVLARLDARAAARDTRCALFDAEPESLLRGRCSEYDERPLVCRAFGFTARRGSHGEAELIACRRLRNDDPTAVARAEADVAAGGAVAFAADHAHAIAAEHPGPEGEQRPINEALRMALDRARTRAHFARLEALEGEPDSREDDRTPPTRPAPRPAA